jgi:hypothetical protein
VFVGRSAPFSKNHFFKNRPIFAVFSKMSFEQSVSPLNFFLNNPTTGLPTRAILPSTILIAVNGRKYESVQHLKYVIEASCRALVPRSFDFLAEERLAGELAPVIDPADVDLTTMIRMSNILCEPVHTFNFLGTHTLTEAYYSYGDVPTDCLCSSYVGLVYHQERWFAVFLIFVRMNVGAYIPHLGRPNTRPFDGLPHRSRLISVLCTEEMMRAVPLSERLRVMSWKNDPDDCAIEGRAFINGNRAAIPYSAQYLDDFARCPLDTSPIPSTAQHRITVLQENSRVAKRRREYAQTICPLQRANIYECTALIAEEQELVDSFDEELAVLTAQIAEIKQKRTNHLNTIKELKDKRSADQEFIDEELDSMMANAEYQSEEDLFRRFLMGAHILSVFVGKNRIVDAGEGDLKSHSFDGLDISGESKFSMAWVLKYLKKFFPTRVYTNFIVTFCVNIPLLHQLDFGRAINYWAVIFPIMMTFASLQISANTSIIESRLINPLEPVSRKRKADEIASCLPSGRPYQPYHVGCLRMRESTPEQNPTLFKIRLDTLFRFGAASPNFDPIEEAKCVSLARTSALMNSKIRTASTREIWLQKNEAAIRDHAIAKYRLSVTKKHFSSLRACRIATLVYEFLGFFSNTDSLSLHSSHDFLVGSYGVPFRPVFFATPTGHGDDATDSDPEEWMADPEV